MEDEHRLEQWIYPQNPVWIDFLDDVFKRNIHVRECLQYGFSGLLNQLIKGGGFGEVSLQRNGLIEKTDGFFQFLIVAVTDGGADGKSLFPGIFSE